MIKSLVVIPDRCMGCHLCELACSQKHYGVMSIERSRIHVVRLHHQPVDAPIFCLQCGLCITSCPVNAIKRDPKTGAITVQEEKCVGCGNCVHVCPYGAVSLDPATRKALICDLCGGDPACVKACPVDALKYLDVDLAAKYKRINFSRLQTVVR